MTFQGKDSSCLDRGYNSCFLPVEIIQVKYVYLFHVFTFFLYLLKTSENF